MTARSAAPSVGRPLRGLVALCALLGVLACLGVGPSEGATGRWGDWREVGGNYYRQAVPVPPRTGVDHWVDEEGRWFSRVVRPGAPLNPMATPEGWRGKYPGYPFLWGEWVSLKGTPVRRVALPRDPQDRYGVDAKGGWVRMDDGAAVPKPRGYLSVSPGTVPPQVPEVSVAAPEGARWRWGGWTRLEGRSLRVVSPMPERQGRTLYVDSQGRWFSRVVTPGAKLASLPAPEGLEGLRPGRPFFLEAPQVIEGRKVRRVVFEPPVLGVSTFLDDQGRWDRWVVVPGAKLEPAPVPEGVVP